MLHDASTAECLVYTYREGLLAAVGHDLCLRVERFAVEVTGEAHAPSILGRFDAASLRATGDVSPADARKIEGNAADDVLGARRFPTIEFRSTRITESGDQYAVDGDLTIGGITHPVTLDVELGGVETFPGGPRHAGFEATAQFRRKDFDIDVALPPGVSSVALGDVIKIEIDLQLLEPDTAA